MEQFGVGRVLARTFSTWAKHFVSFFIVTAAVQLPTFLYTYATKDSGGEGKGQWIVIILTLLLQFVAMSSITYGVFQSLRGAPISIGRALGVGFARLPSILVLALIFILIMIGVIIAAVLGGMLIGLIFGAISPTLGGILAMIFMYGLILAIMVRFMVAFPVAVVEQPGAGASLSRSSFLTEGNRWKIFFVFLLVFALIGGVQYLVMRALIEQPSVLVVVSWVLQVALGALFSVSVATIYHDLRVSKEGVGIEELAAVFE